MIEKVKNEIAGATAFQELVVATSKQQPGEIITLNGMSGSLTAIVVGCLSDVLHRQLLIVACDQDSAERKHDDLQLIIKHRKVGFFGGHKDHHQLERRRSVEDIESLRLLLSDPTSIAITNPEGLSMKLPKPSEVTRDILTIELGRGSSFSKTVHRLQELGFEKKDFVEGYGDYSVRGGIIDVFPFVGENPVRVEFFGDEVESIREFDPVSQRSIKELSTATVVPDFIGHQPHDQASLIDFLAKEAIIVLEKPELIQRSIEESAHSEDQLAWTDVREVTSLFPQIHVVTLRPQSNTINLGSLSQPAFNGSIKSLRSNLQDLQLKHFDILIGCDTQSELHRIKELLTETDKVDELTNPEVLDRNPLDLSRVNMSLDVLHEGFLLPELKLAVYTEHQIFNRLKRRGKRKRSPIRGFTKNEVHQLHTGDYVVHVDYGIGRFDGLRRIRVHDVEQEVVKLQYEQKDILYVNLNYLKKIQKYSSKEGHTPKLTRLGTSEWDKLKSRAKNRVKDIARDLISLYAKRKHEQGFVFQRDSLWQKELEASFMYEDTFDQAKATLDVKRDMEAPFPMDRLVCGDVGFGKTEVAVRAAFKAVMSGKQVAILVPTTILALQHYNTFLDRTSKYATNIQVISRLKTKKEQSRILEELNAGAIDIIIGTHRLLSRDVRFKDLGLLIIDEEHRFGVAAKERLRLLKETVDTLTLTATPIPRTLHFSLMGARDLSIIATAPRNRLPIITEIARYDERLIKEAIRKEVHRGGQVYFVHDRVSNIEEVTAHLRVTLSELRIDFAHGQMHAHELENVMLDFLEKRSDVLVCTKIIESGLDIPNVNTIIVNRADRFGLAELYQLRGRVGRSNVQAYAFLLTPPISLLPRTTLQKLQALEEYTELGSGFNLAMRDLEIRGAGNLLGGEQSGFIETMGFEMYTKILEEAVTELKEQEFQDLFEVGTSGKRSMTETAVEIEYDALIPDTYVANDAERLAIYRRLYALTSRAQLDEIGNELEDRFGILPREVENLLWAIRIRMAASSLGLSKVRISHTQFEIEFPPTSFYEGESFQRIMSFISHQPKHGLRLKQSGNLLVLSVKYPQGFTSGAFAFAEAFIHEIESASTANQEAIAVHSTAEKLGG